MILKCDFFTHFGSCFLKLHDVSTSHLEALVPINEPWTGIPAAPDLPPAPASWASPAKENITWPRLLDERSKPREVSRNTIQSEWKSHITNSCLFYKLQGPLVQFNTNDTGWGDQWAMLPPKTFGGFFFQLIYVATFLGCMWWLDGSSFLVQQW